MRFSAAASVSASAPPVKAQRLRDGEEAAGGRVRERCRRDRLERPGGKIARGAAAGTEQRGADAATGGRDHPAEAVAEANGAGLGIEFESAGIA